MVTCTQHGPPCPCPLETSAMMAHNPCQVDFIKMKAQGEGNYASTMFSNPRDQKTGHGLTLSPKIQSKDPWLFDTDAFGDQSLGTLLGPVQFDLTEDETTKNGSETEALFNDQYQLLEPPAKRRRTTSELPTAVMPQLEFNEPGFAQETLSGSAGKSNQVPQTPSSGISELQLSHAVPREVVYQDGHLHSMGQLEQLHGHLGAEKPSLDLDVQGGLQSIADSRDKESDAEVLHNFDDDGSLFGDYVSSKEGSVECSPIAEASSIEAEAELCETESSSVPTLLWDPDVPIPSVERDLPPVREICPSVGRKSGSNIPQTPKTYEAFSTGAKLLNVDQKCAKAFPTSSLQILAGQDNNPPNESERCHSQTNKASTFSSSRKSLLLSLVLTLAAPALHDYSEQTVNANKTVLRSAHSGDFAPTDSTPHHVPPQLNQLLDNLHHKFNQDESFRKSTITWAVNKMENFGSLIGYEQDADGNPDFTRGLEFIGDIDHAKDLILQERRGRFATETILLEDIYRLEQRLENANNLAAIRLTESLHVQHRYNELYDAFNELRIDRDNLRAMVEGGTALMHVAPRSMLGAAPSTNHVAVNSIRSPSQITAPAPTAVDFTVSYFTCQHPEPDRANRVCGGRNESCYKRGTQKVTRKICARCRFDITKPGMRRFISKTDFDAAGGRSKRKCSGGQRVATSEFSQPSGQYVAYSPTNNSTNNSTSRSANSDPSENTPSSNIIAPDSSQAAQSFMDEPTRCASPRGLFNALATFVAADSHQVAQLDD